MENKEKIILSPVRSYESLVSVKENTDKKRTNNKKERKKKIRIEHKPNWTLFTLRIILKYYPNN